MYDKHLKSAFTPANWNQVWAKKVFHANCFPFPSKDKDALSHGGKLVYLCLPNSLNRFSPSLRRMFTHLLHAKKSPRMHVLTQLGTQDCSSVTFMELSGSQNAEFSVFNGSGNWGIKFRKLNAFQYQFPLEKRLGMFVIQGQELFSFPTHNGPCPNLINEHEETFVLHPMPSQGVGPSSHKNTVS